MILAVDFKKKQNLIQVKDIASIFNYSKFYLLFC